MEDFDSIDNIIVRKKAAAVRMAKADKRYSVHFKLFDSEMNKAIAKGNFEKIKFLKERIKLVKQYKDNDMTIIEHGAAPEEIKECFKELKLDLSEFNTERLLEDPLIYGLVGLRNMLKEGDERLLADALVFLAIKIELSPL